MDTSATSSNMAGNTDSTPRRRRECFSDKENIIVLDEVMVNAEKLFGENALNAAGRAEIWRQIVQKVNEEGKKDRTGIECRKRLPEYKRKIKNIIEKAIKSGNSNWEDILSKRQLRVAKFFNMLSDTNNEAEYLCDEISSDGESSTNSAEAINIDLSGVFDDDVIPGTTFSASFDSTVDALDQSGTQSNEQTPSVQPDSKIQEPAEPKKSVQKLQVDNLEGKLITFHKENNDILRGIQASLSSNLRMQKKMNRLHKIKFIKMQKSMNQSQKASKGREDIMDLRLKSILTTLEDLKDTLIEKMQDSPTSDDSDDDPGLV